jgi:NAD+ kinase
MAKSNPLVQLVGIVYNPEKERAYHENVKLKKWLQHRGIKSTSNTRVSATMKNCSFVVALGGDGTVLSVARAVAPWGVPVLGVNVGRLGFLAATELPVMYRTLSRVLAGQNRVENRTLISVKGIKRGKSIGPYLGLNDCVIRSGGTGRVLMLEASIQGRPLAKYIGDGLIVSTPTGSTAYNLAASGPIIHPDLDVLILAPICPHSLSQRPLVLPTFEVITIIVDRPSPDALLSIDGQVNHQLLPGDRVEIRRATEQAQLLMDADRSFYQVLQNKLKWGGS